MSCRLKWASNQYIEILLGRSDSWCLHEELAIAFLFCALCFVAASQPANKSISADQKLAIGPIGYTMDLSTGHLIIIVRIC